MWSIVEISHRREAGLVRQQLVLECVSATGATQHLDAALEYVASDPYAVRLHFDTSAPGVVWVFGRDLLQTGFVEPAGVGDVHIWPGRDESGSAVTAIELRSPEGNVTLHVRAHDVFQFLARSLALVPAGEESDRLDLDLLVEQLRATA